MKSAYRLTILFLALSVLACSIPGSAVTPTGDPVTVVVAPYASPTIAATPTPADTATPEPVLAKAVGDINVRTGPGLDQAVVGILKDGETAHVVGRSEDVPWVQVAWTASPNGLAWVFNDVVAISGDVSSVPAVTITVNGTPVVVPTTAPTTVPEPGKPGIQPTPYGCQKPPDDYTIVSEGEGININRRTEAMLIHAQELYGGKHDFLKAITQGSYNVGVVASFGTHDGGGAVDISVRDFSTYEVLSSDLPVIILALREAGFAAWVREEGELGSGSPIHIHMIAVGDKDLSEAARRQIDGVEGYLRGYNGLPVDPPVKDKWGPPIICPWMEEMGFTDLRGAP